MNKPVSIVSVRLDLESAKKWTTLRTKLNKSNKELLTDIINNYYSTMVDNSTDIGMMSSDLSSIKITLDELQSIIKKNTEDTMAIRKGLNTILTTILVVLKETFRSIHLLSNYILHTSKFDRVIMTKVVSETNTEAANAFSTSYATITSATPKDIVEALKK